jgi:hypothetical protein
MSQYTALALAASALAWPVAAADRVFDPDACAKAVAPYLDDRTVAVLHIDLTAVDVDVLAAKAAALVKADADSLPVPRKEAAAAVKMLTDAGARDLFLVVSLADVPEQQPFVVVPLEKEGDAKKLAGMLSPPGVPAVHAYGAYWRPYQYEAIGAALVGGGEATLKRLRDLKTYAPPDLAKAFAAAGGGLAQLAIVPPKDAAKIMDQLMPTLPIEVGGGPSKILTQGFHWAAVGLDAPKLKLSMTVQAADADSAKSLLDLLKKSFAAVGKSQDVREALPDYDKLTELVTPKVAGDQLTLTLDEQALTTGLKPLLAKAAEAAARNGFTNRLQQLAAASHSYLDANRTFPPAATHDNKGNALLSWRVYLLPYLGEDKLFKEFHLDEPWDSDNNKKLIARMPGVFRSAADPKLTADGKTTFLAPVGDATMFPVGRGVRIAEVTDGTANTILYVHADDDYAVVWTKPDDLIYDPKAPEKGLFGRFPGGALAVFADGSVHFLSKNISKETLRALFTRSGGEVPGPDFRP